MLHRLDLGLDAGLGPLLLEGLEDGDGAVSVGPRTLTVASVSPVSGLYASTSSLALATS